MCMCMFPNYFVQRLEGREGAEDLSGVLSRADLSGLLVADI